MLATKNVRAQILEAKQCVETKLYSPNLCLGKSIVVVVWFVCQVLHVVVRNAPLISLDTVTVMEDDRKLYEINQHFRLTHGRSFIVQLQFFLNHLRA